MNNALTETQLELGVVQAQMASAMKTIDELTQQVQALTKAVDQLKDARVSHNDHHIRQIDHFMVVEPDNDTTLLALTQDVNYDSGYSDDG